MVEAFNLAFDLDDKEGVGEEESQNKQLNKRLVSRDEEVQVRSLKRLNVIFITQPQKDIHLDFCQKYFFR